MPYCQGVICLLREIVRKERKEASDEWSMFFWDLVNEEGRRTWHGRSIGLVARNNTLERVNGQKKRLR